MKASTSFVFMFLVVLFVMGMAAGLSVKWWYDRAERRALEEQVVDQTLLIESLQQQADRAANDAQAARDELRQVREELATERQAKEAALTEAQALRRRLELQAMALSTPPALWPPCAPHGTAGGRSDPGSAAGRMVTGKQTADASLARWSSVGRRSAAKVAVVGLVLLGLGFVLLQRQWIDSVQGRVANAVALGSPVAPLRSDHRNGDLLLRMSPRQMSLFLTWLDSLPAAPTEPARRSTAGPAGGDILRSPPQH